MDRLEARIKVFEAVEKTFRDHADMAIVQSHGENSFGISVATVAWAEGRGFMNLHATTHTVPSGEYVDGAVYLSPENGRGSRLYLTRMIGPLVQQELEEYLAETHGLPPYILHRLDYYVDKNDGAARYFEHLDGGEPGMSADEALDLITGFDKFTKPKMRQTPYRTAEEIPPVLSAANRSNQPLFSFLRAAVSLVGNN